MLIRNAERNLAKIKLALQGPSGSGKTYSALLLARGLTGSLSNVCVIDTENGGGDLYAHLGDYKVISLPRPHTPEQYIQAIELAENSGMECIIIDSISHCWEYLLDYHATLPGNSFTNWSKITPRLNSLVSKILHVNAHLIATLRVKQDYILQEKGNGKVVPEKVGLKPIQRDGFDYEFTIVFDLDVRHFASCTKDRTGLFMDAHPFMITTETGEKISKWCDSAITIDSVRELIQNASSIQELTEIFKQHRSYYSSLESEFQSKKALLNNIIINTLKTDNHGIKNGI
jgi:hypothetical protein